MQLTTKGVVDVSYKGGTMTSTISLGKELAEPQSVRCKSNVDWISTPISQGNHGAMYSAEWYVKFNVSENTSKIGRSGSFTFTVEYIELTEVDEREFELGKTHSPDAYVKWDSVYLRYGKRGLISTTVNVSQSAQESKIEKVSVDSKSITKDSIEDARKHAKEKLDELNDKLAPARKKIVDFGKDFLNDYMSKALGIDVTVDQLMKGKDTVVNEAKQLEVKLSEMKLKVDKYKSSSHVPKCKVDYLDTKYKELESEFQKADSKAKAWASEKAQWANTHKKELLNKALSSTMGASTANAVDNIQTQYGILAKSVPALAKTIGKTIIEPAGAVVITPVGPGSVAANPIQTANNIMKIASQVGALSACINSIVGSAMVLGLDKKYIDPLVELAAIMGAIASLA